ncbi:MAG: M60 family metallopeptidase [Marinifilaceae bacterium]
MLKSLFTVLLLSVATIVSAKKANTHKVVAQPYYDIALLAKELKTSRYNPFENPTGLYFKQGEEIVVHVDKLPDAQNLELIIVDWSKPLTKEAKKEITCRFPLQKGENKVLAANQGLAYISYYTPAYKTAPQITCTFKGGTPNGVFNGKKHNNKEWNKMLSSAVFEVIDIQGERVHLVFPVADLLEKCPNAGLELINQYDEIIGWQQDLLGIDQFGLRTNNRMFGRISWSGNPNANGKGVSFPRVKGILTPQDITKNNWVIGHEFGHVNQVRPGLKWHGTTEITTNIFSCWVQYKLNPQGPYRMESAVGPNGFGQKEIAGLFNWHLNHTVVNGKPLLGNFEPEKELLPAENRNPFVRLSPFWQLQICNALAGIGVEDYYAQIAHHLRNTDQKGMSPGELQLNFMRLSAQVMKLDMSLFFEQCGMLRPVDTKIGDYGGDRDMCITPAQVQELKTEMAGYPKPVSPVLHYISMNNVNAFKSQLPVQGEQGKGVEKMDNNCKISHKNWKNVVAFEAYRDNTLARVTMVGTGSEDNAFTMAAFPADCNRLMAVAWDGSRHIVLIK